MEINEETLSNKSENEIVGFLIDYVTKTEEEIEEEEQGDRKTTDLKLFIAKKEGFELGSIESTLTELVKDPSVHQNTREFINNRNISEEKINDSVSLVTIRTSSYNRKDKFVLIDSGEYVRIYTIERRYWTKRTIERLMDYLPGLSRLYLSANDIEDIVEGLDEEITETDVSGFTAKYYSYGEDRRISVRFHGGDENDLLHMENEFNATPTRVEFSQKNSPVDAVNGAITRDARVNIPNIKFGSEGLGAETLGSVADRYEELDKENFQVPVSPEITKHEQGLAVEGFTSVRLVNQTGQDGSKLIADGNGGAENEQVIGSDETLMESLKTDILERKQRYRFTEWVPGDYQVLDKERHETFQVGVEEKDLVVHARPETTPITIKNFCRIILEEFNSSYRIENRSKRIHR